jgi:hypothetical protein
MWLLFTLDAVMPKRRKYKYHQDGTLPEKEENFILVFGSNLRGAHGRGLAVIAHKEYGAEYGVGVGFTGRSYAIPTKDRFIRTLDLIEIKKYVDLFKAFTHEHPEMKFWVSGVGTGLAGYRASQIAPLFRDCNTNCNFPHNWIPYLH